MNLLKFIVIFCELIVCFPLFGKLESLLLKNFPVTRDECLFFVKKHSFCLQKCARDSSDLPVIDILIPAVEKDAEVLPLVIEYAKHYVLHPIANIYIVSPSSSTIIEISKKLGCIYIDESKALNISKESIFYFPQNMDRRGWLLQQLIKLNADVICSMEHILILDADTILLSDSYFTQENKSFLICADEYHLPYRTCYKKLIRQDAFFPLSFVSHMALFERQKLQELKKHIENIHQKPWYEAILDCLDRNEISSFSEYETYSQYVLCNYPDNFIVFYGFNKSYSRKYLSKFRKSYFIKSSSIKSASFHDWIENK